MKMTLVEETCVAISTHLNFLWIGSPHNTLKAEIETDERLDA